MFPAARDRGPGPAAFTATGARGSSHPRWRAAWASSGARRLAQLVAICDVYTLEAAPPRRGPQPPPDGARPGRAARTAAGGTLMARVLAYTTPARGHLFPVTPILDELRGRGHEVALRTLASQVELMRARGFDAAPIDPAIERDRARRLPRSHARSARRSGPMHVSCRRAELDAARPAARDRRGAARRAAGRHQRLGRAGRRRGLGRRLGLLVSLSAPAAVA